MARASIGLVGKLPASADFLRIRAGSEVFQALLGWMIDGVQHGAARGRSAVEAPPALSDAAARAMAVGPAVQALCYRGRPGTSALAGAIAPSADQAGRRFPIAAACELDIDAALAEHPEALPLVLESVWAVTSQLVIDLQQQGRAEIEAAQPYAELEVSVPDAVATYRSWTDALELDDFLALVFEGDAAHAASALALTDEAVAPYVGVENPDTPLSLRLPLGQAGGAAVCFWLDLIVRLTGWRRTVPSFFWSHDGSSGALMLHLGRVPAAALGELWQPTGASDEVCDLAFPERSFRSSRASRWERILADPDLTVSELLRAAVHPKRGA